MKFFIIIGSFLGIIAVLLLLFGNAFFGFVPNKNPQELFIVEKTDSLGQVQKNLRDKGYLTTKDTFFTFAEIAGGLFSVAPGGYMLQKDMSPWQLVMKLKNPDYAWVTIPPGKRKEEIGNILRVGLHWDSATLDTWNALQTVSDETPLEGELYPDTYLLPTHESPSQIAHRIVAHFNDVFAPYLTQFTQQNIRWTTGLKIASLVQREAAGPDDMPLIAGILWNRLEKGMPLEIDATVIYARGDAGQGWWAPLSPGQTKTIDSPYNTYEHAGLPPTPICSPSLTAIKAVINPADTQCLYYLHDGNRQIHCAVTYAEHVKNIQTYLNN